MEVYRVTLYLPPSYVEMVSTDPRITSPVPLIPTLGEALSGDLHVYTSVYTQARATQLCIKQSIKAPLVFASPCWLLAITGPKRPLPSTTVVPSTRSVLASHGDSPQDQATADDSRLKIYCSDQLLTRSLKSPPSTHSIEVLDWLHELLHSLHIRMYLLASMSINPGSVLSLPGSPPGN